jgi:hypothetical protein
MDDTIKKLIDDMPYEEMLRKWRFAPLSDTMFVGETGAYFSKVMKDKKEKLGQSAHVAASKRIGWG